MTDANMSAEVREALSSMNFDETPTINELITRYIKLALKCHPDKNGGSETSKEAYQKLQNQYKVLGDYIIQKNSANNDVINDDEMDHVNIFRNFNMDKKNSKCHIVIIEEELVAVWKTVLTEVYGEPEDRKENGFLYVHNDYDVNEELFKITVTLYSSTSKLHIQSAKQFANDQFTFGELPNLYAKVRKLSKHDNAVNCTNEPETGYVTKRGRNIKAPHTSTRGVSVKTISKTINQSCKFTACTFKSKIKKNLNTHMKEHKNKYDKKRNIPHDITIEPTPDTVVDMETQDVVIPILTNSNEVESEPEKAKADSERYKLKLEELQGDLSEKEKCVNELDAKIKDLEKQKKGYLKEIDKINNEKEELRKEYDTAIEKSKDLFEENTKLKEEVKIYQDLQVANMEAQQKLKESRKETAEYKLKFEELLNEKNKEADNDDNVNIECIVLNKAHGYRRTSPCSKPVHVGESAPEPIKNNDKGPIHEDTELHQKCEICPRQYKTPYELRNHLRDDHGNFVGH